MRSRSALSKKRPGELHIESWNEYAPPEAPSAWAPLPQQVLEPAA